MKVKFSPLLMILVTTENVLLEEVQEEFTHFA